MTSPSMYPLGRTALSLAAAVLLLGAASARADDPGWPREFETSSGTFMVYQPQPERLDGDVLEGRAAFSVQKDPDANPVFGVLWFTEQIQIDRDSSTVDARSLDVTRVRLPGITSDQATRYERLVEDEAAGWDLSGSLEELQAGLAAAEKERASVEGLDNTPPRIRFHARRAILVVYDGEPALEPIGDSRLEGVVNTPYAVIYDPQSRVYYLNGANLWYRARNPLGPWTPTATPPSAVRDVVPPDTSTYDQVEGPPPDVLTATEPTELIATDGPADWAPLVDDELLYVANTESDVIREVSTQNVFVLISGRWFRAPSTDGPWTFVRGDQLPTSFREIPPDSPKGQVLASVAGTDQADDALADAEIPQTSAIRRSDTSLTVAYDGDPEFEPIEGTDLQYAVNTDAEVILADGRYYACDQGVWYIADDAEGPWAVSETRPLGLEDIPPSCPVYDARYVYVYDATPDVVYAGYLPGYLGCYPYYGTVVYGTGYHYRGWRGRHHYYPRRFTWGFYARYNPWLSRWSFGFSYSSGFLRTGTRWHWGSTRARTRVRSAWFGPGGFRRPLLRPDRTLARERPTRIRTRVSDLPANVYSRPSNVTRVDLSANRTRGRSIARPIPRPGMSNDLFAGKDGRVYRRDRSGGWEVRQGTEWKPTDLPPATAPTRTRTPATPARPEVTPDPRRPPVERQVETRERRSQPPPPPTERPTRPERPFPPPARPIQERPTPPQERRQDRARPERPIPPAAQRQLERREQQREERRQPRERTPGDLEREYRARERAERRIEPPPPAARPTPPPQEREKVKQEEPKKQEQEQEKERERPRSREEEKRSRTRNR